jgi:hypothetical protein
LARKLAAIEATSFLAFFHNQKDKAKSGKKLQIIFPLLQLKSIKIVIFAW